MFHEGAGCLGAPQKSANSLWLRLQFHWLPANLLDGSVVSARQAHFSFLTFPSAFDSGSRGGTGGAGPHNTVELANCRRLVPLKLHERRRRVENNPGRRGAHLTAAHVLQRATNCLGSQSIGRFRLGCAALVTRLAGRQAGWLAGWQPGCLSAKCFRKSPSELAREKRENKAMFRHTLPPEHNSGGRTNCATLAPSSFVPLQQHYDYHRQLISARNVRPPNCSAHGCTCRMRTLLCARNALHPKASAGSATATTCAPPGVSLGSPEASGLRAADTFCSPPPGLCRKVTQ